MWFTVYLATNLCCHNIQYIGETGRRLAHRVREHIGNVKSANLTQPTGNHFNLPGHTLSNIKVTVLKNVKKTIQHIGRSENHI